MSSVSMLGRGWAYPVGVNAPAHALTYAEGPEKVRQAIRIVLDTEPGERVMRPAFGCGLRRYLMEPNTVAVRALIQHDVELALRTWEPRIALSRIEVKPGADPVLVEISIEYVHVRTGRPDALVHVLALE